MAQALQRDWLRLHGHPVVVARCLRNLAGDSSGEVFAEAKGSLRGLAPGRLVIRLLGCAVDNEGNQTIRPTDCTVISAAPSQGTSTHSSIYMPAVSIPKAWSTVKTNRYKFPWQGGGRGLPEIFKIWSVT